LQLLLTATADPGWHVYAYAPRDPEEVAKPTLIVLTEPSSWTAGPIQASSPPVSKPASPDEPEIAYHTGPVTWTADINVPDSVTVGEYEIAGLIGYQTCTDTSCDRPRAAKFTATITVGDAISDQSQTLSFTTASYTEAARLAAAEGPDAVVPEDGAPAAGQADIASNDNAGTGTGEAAASAAEVEPTATADKDIHFGLALAYAFLGGLILNIMPCVLPVIGLKIMTFVQQSGEKRSRILALNIWYSLGLIAVFLVLATTLVIWNQGWGQHFGNQTFAITMAALVFAMGLSFLGVWEIPIPGFVGSAKANELADKEGPAGAFSKGVITTILATPCSGPGIAIALGYCNGKPSILVYLIFAMLGLGMASPYLLIGAFPRLIRFLPKPGMWMETFKQVMGFVLMGTVIYLLSFIDWSNILPTLTLLLGLAGGFWWIGRTSITADFQVRLRTWLAGAAFACLAGLYAFSGKTTVGVYELSGLQGVMEHRLDKFILMQAAKQSDIDELLGSPQITQHDTEIRWVPFSEQRLDRLIKDNRTVMIDFTADWCLTCKALETTVLNTQEVRDSLRKNGVVALLADWTKGDPEISEMLESLGSKQVPVLAIFPAGRPEDRIVLMGGYTQATLLERLNEAGPSGDPGNDAADRVARATGGGS
jgi:thiol:disulfide interchange protein